MPRDETEIEIEGYLGIINGHGEASTRLFEEWLPGDRITVKENEDDIEVLKDATLLLSHTPVLDEKDNGREEARKIKEILLRNNGSMLTIFAYRTPEDLERSYKSQFVDELSKTFGIGRVTGFPATDDIHVPYGKDLYVMHFQEKTFSMFELRMKRVDSPTKILEFILERGKYTHRLVNTGELAILKGLEVGEDSTMYMEIDSFAPKQVAISRQLRVDYKNLMLVLEKYGKGAYEPFDQSLTPESNAEVSSVLNRLAGMKTAGRVPIHGARGSFYALAFGAAVKENKEMYARMLNESAHYLLQSQRQRPEKKIPTTSHIPADLF